MLEEIKSSTMVLVKLGEFPTFFLCLKVVNKILTSSGQTLL